jgi:perosamine synthetase
METVIQVPQFRSYIDEEDYRNLAQVFERNYLAEGPCALEFSERLLELTGAEYGVFAPNGTLALYLAFKGLGIGPGDEVIVQDMTFIASANAVQMAGAEPRFVDVRAPNDLSIDLDRVTVHERTKAMVVVPLFGTGYSNIAEVLGFCEENDLHLIEDAAQALGVTDGVTHCGCFGDVGTFSFYADKTITTGEGGFLVTPHEDVHEKLVFLRNQGRKKSGTFVHPEMGYNFRMTDMQCALGLSQMSKLGEIIERKEALYREYRRRLEGAVDFLVLNEDFNHIPFRVVVFVDDAAQSMAYMKERGVEPRSVFYPLHKQPCYQDSQHDPADFPNSTECFRRGICLPTWIGLSEEQIDHTCTVLLESLDNEAG